MINQFFLFWQKFIGLIEFLSNSMIEKHHLHGTYFEACTQYSINYLPYILVLDSMRFDNT